MVLCKALATTDRDSGVSEPAEAVLAVAVDRPFSYCMALTRRAPGRQARRVGAVVGESRELDHSQSAVP